MSTKHTLAARLRDLQIEFKLWLAAWLAASVALAASLYLYLRPAANGELWRDYLLARLLDFIGLGAVSIPGWHTPSLVVQFVKDELSPAIVTIWDRDFALLLQSPAYALIVLSLAFLVFFDRKA